MDQKPFKAICKVIAVALGPFGAPAEGLLRWLDEQASEDQQREILDAILNGNRLSTEHTEAVLSELVDIKEASQQIAITMTSVLQAILKSNAQPNILANIYSGMPLTPETETTIAESVRQDHATLSQQGLVLHKNVITEIAAEYDTRWDYFWNLVIAAGYHDVDVFKTTNKEFQCERFLIHLYRSTYTQSERKKISNAIAHDLPNNTILQNWAHFLSAFDGNHILLRHITESLPTNI